jgi:hypothetical protein
VDGGGEGRGVQLWLKKGEGKGKARDVMVEEDGERTGCNKGGDLLSGEGGESVAARRRETDRKGEEARGSRWCLIDDGNGGGRL